MTDLRRVPTRASSSSAGPGRRPAPPRRAGYFGDGGTAVTRWPTVLLVWVTLMTALASMHTLFQGVGWFAAGALVSAVVLGTSTLLRSLRLSAWPAWGAGVVVGAAVSTALVSGGTALLGVIPTPATIARVDTLTADASATIVGGSAPVEVGDGTFALIVVSMFVVAVLVDLLATVGQMPGLTGVFPAVMVLVPAFVPLAATSWPWVVATVVSYLALLMASTGRRPTRAGLLGAGAAVAVAGLLTTVIPLTGVSPLSGTASGTGLATGVNPIIDLGNDLRRGAPVTVLSYTTTDPGGTYLKLVDLVDFSGQSWSPAEVRLDPADRIDELPDAPGIDPATTRRDVVTDVAVTALRSPYLPLPVPATAIDGLDDQWKYVDESGVTVRSDTTGTQGLSYEVASRPVDPTTEQVVGTLGDAPSDMGAYLSVEGVPESVTALAADVTADAPNPFDAAVELQDYFRNGDFTYSEDTPVERGYDGSGLDMIQEFLRVKSGYCVHFASAMAVMARTIGIPSRVAVGFLPGQSVGGDGRFRVSSDDLHTWPELYFQGLGWVPFEPTVGLGSPQSYLQQTGVEPSAAPSASDEPAPSASAAPTQSAAPTAGAPTDDPTGTAASPSTGGAAGQGAVVAGLIALIVLAALLVVPGVLRYGRRRRRLGAAPPDAALEAWREVLDTADDLRMPIDRGATPAAAAAALDATLARRGDTEEARRALAELAADLEAERFGAVPAGDRVGAAARAVIGGLERSVTPADRLVARLLPRSLATTTEARTGVSA